MTGGATTKIILHRGTAHYRTPTALYVGVGARWQLDRVRALRVLEVLAYSFHDYATRESVCGRGLFGPPLWRRGRPSARGLAMTARERMRKMRERKQRA